MINPTCCRKLLESSLFTTSVQQRDHEANVAKRFIVDSFPERESGFYGNTESQKFPFYRQGRQTRTSKE